MLVNPRGFRRRFISTRARCPADTGATVWSHFGLKVETHEFAPRRDDEWVGGRLFHAEPLGDLSEVGGQRRSWRRAAAKRAHA